MRVRELMTRRVETAEAGEPLRGAAHRMRVHGIGLLPVLEDGRLVGVVTDRDITIRAVALGKDPNTTPVREAMTATVITIRADAPLPEAERLMEEEAVRRLVVLDAEGNLAGVLSLDDLGAVPGSAERAGEVLERVNGF